MLAAIRQRQPDTDVHWGDSVAVINGVAAAPIMAMVMLMASREAVMGQFTLTKWLTVLGWLGTAIMAAAAVGMFATLGS